MTDLAEKYRHHIQPARFAGWYPETRDKCAGEIESYLAQGLQSTDLAEVYGGVVPHAGWYFSGSVAAQTFRGMSQVVTPETVVVLGTVHRIRLHQPNLLLARSWKTSMGEIEIDWEMSLAALDRCPRMIVSPEKHETEHSIEVELPLVQHLFPKANLVAVMVPPHESAKDLALALVESAKDLGRKAVYIASTDLSHYGRSFGYEPYGPLPKALEDVHEIDRRFIDRVLGYRVDELVGEAEKNRNACGAGATACMVEACRLMGGGKAELIEYTTSCEIRPSKGDDSTVGYSSILLGS